MDDTFDSQDRFHIFNVDNTCVNGQLPKIEDDANKYTRGSLLIAGSSKGMAGALILSAKAAFLTGCGYLKLLLPESTYVPVTVSIPEAVCKLYSENSFNEGAEEETFKEAFLKNDAVVFGPGLSKNRGYLFEKLKENIGGIKKLIVDADGLKALSESGYVFPGTTEVLLTPHEGEMAYLLGESAGYIRNNRVKALIKASEKYNASVLLKGPETLIITKEGIYRGHYGDASLARAGSGDVLSGIIGSLAAQGLSVDRASFIGAFLHGKAALKAAGALGKRSVSPSEMLNVLPEIIKAADENLL